VLDRPSLLLDIGNTSIKYSWYRFPESIADLQVLRTTLEGLPELLEEASTCWLCSVVGNDTSNKISELCKNINIPFQQVRTQKEQFYISNAYSKPENMGADRWMAIIAGSALCDKGNQSHYVAIDAGTAITCDFVVGNKHLGGWIAPGLSMARTAVVTQTKKVFDEVQALDKLTLGNDTPECVAQGALAQLTGMLSQACKIMQTHSTKFEIYISGGDAPLLINTFRELEKGNQVFNINYVENLVLIGLAKVAHENIAKIV
jgi:type III pantothenate kinase